MPNKNPALHRQLTTNLYLRNVPVYLIAPGAEVPVKVLKHHASLIGGAGEKFNEVLVWRMLGATQITVAEG